MYIYIYNAITSKAPGTSLDLEVLALATMRPRGFRSCQQPPKSLIFLDMLTSLLAGGAAPYSYYPAKIQDVSSETLCERLPNSSIQLRMQQQECRKPRKTTKPHPETRTHTQTHTIKHICLPSAHDRSDHDACLLVHALKSQKVNAARCRPPDAVEANKFEANSTSSQYGQVVGSSSRRSSTQLTQHPFSAHTANVKKPRERTL